MGNDSKKIALLRAISANLGLDLDAVAFEIAAAAVQTEIERRNEELHDDGKK